MIDKKEFSDKFIGNLKEIANKSLKKNNLNKCLTAISVAGDYLYQYNQYYTDDELENYISLVSDILKKKNNFGNLKNNTEKIIVYDGFGLDIRGTILIYLNALGLNNYPVVYITNKNVKNKIPTIISMCNKYNFIVEYIDMENYVSWTKQLALMFQKYEPKAAFFYTLPNDVSGIAAFHMFEGCVDRYLIDLTDHAFWLGKIAVDYVLGSRDMSAYLEFYQRKIPKSKLKKLDINLLVDECENHNGLPFNPEDTKYIFSGGSLYKTLGDEEKIYYKIVDHILFKHKNINFLYAGHGDDSEMRKIEKKYPDRTFLIEERKDYYYLIKNSIFYLNTYPMFGGMMMRYAALAHKLPITLKHNSDSDGILIHQTECNIEYDKYEDLIKDVDLLIENEEYLKKREKLLDGAVVTEERLKNNIKSLIENHKTDEDHNFIEIDTSKFKKEYYERFDCKKQLYSIVNKKNISLLLDYPNLFIEVFFSKLIKKIKKWRNK